MISIGSDIGMLLFPRFCKVCGEKLYRSEQHICTSCLRRLPRTHYDPTALNPVMQHFVGYPAVEHATAYFFYSHGNAYSRLITRAKYNNQPETGRYMSRLAAGELSGSGFFDGIDSLLPVPLSARRRWRRGYNQSEWIARGIADQTGLPIDTQSLIRRRHNETQTHMSREERWQNVRNIFSVRHPERLRGHHVLLVDDVVTTGATLMSCVETLSQAVADIRISIFALACDRQE